MQQEAGAVDVAARARDVLRRAGTQDERKAGTLDGAGVWCTERVGRQRVCTEA